jgi:DNA primase
VQDAEGKDRVIAQIRPILSAMPPSVLREDLARRVADRLKLSPSIAALLVVADPTAPVEAPAAVSSAGTAAAAAPAEGGTGLYGPPPTTVPQW